MANAKVLTPEQVARMQELWVEKLSPDDWDELLASHEALRGQLAVVQENWRAQAEHDAERLADAQADVRALAEAARLFVEWYRHGADWKELSAVDKTEDALARPGVVQVLAAGGS